jgi:hypothetical protein
MVTLWMGPFIVFGPMPTIFHQGLCWDNVVHVIMIDYAIDILSLTLSMI